MITSKVSGLITKAVNLYYYNVLSLEVSEKLKVYERVVVLKLPGSPVGMPASMCEIMKLTGNLHAFS